MSRNCSSSLFTSLTGRPQPFAIRERREPFRISGFLRSCGVMDNTMASMCFMRFGSILTSFSIFEFTPGSSFSRFSSGPSFCI